jgi:hypothetical protein
VSKRTFAPKCWEKQYASSIWVKLSQTSQWYAQDFSKSSKNHCKLETAKFQYEIFGPHWPLLFFPRNLQTYNTHRWESSIKSTHFSHQVVCPSSTSQ